MTQCCMIVPEFCLQIGDTEEEDSQGAGGAAHTGQAMHMDDDHDEHHGLDEASLKEHEEVTKVKVSARCSTTHYLVHVMGQGKAAAAAVSEAAAIAATCRPFSVSDACAL